MQTFSSAAGRICVRPDLYIKLEDYYSDSVVNHQLLNKLLLNCNMLVAYLYRVIINASLQSRSTCEARRAYREFLDTHFRKSQSRLINDSVLLGFDKQQLQIRHFELIESRQQPRTGATAVAAAGASGGSHGDSLRSRPPKSSEESAQLDIIQSGLHLPRRGRGLWLVSTMVVLLESFLVARYAVAFYVLLNSFARQTYVTRANSIQSFESASIASIRLDYGELLNASSSWTNQPDCRARFLKFADENYNDFRVWNASRGFQNSRLAGALMPEQKASFQVFVQEVRVSCYLLGGFILTCGLVGRLVAESIRYDLTPMLFIFDPNFIAFSLQVRLNYYLDLMRSSYMNYWSNFRIATDGALIMSGRNSVFDVILGRCSGGSRRQSSNLAKEEDQCEESDCLTDGDMSSDEANQILEGLCHYVNSRRKTLSTGGSGGGGGGGGGGDSARRRTRSPSISAARQRARRRGRANSTESQANIIDSVCLNHQIFDDYMPTVRSRSWRQFLILWNPVAQFFLVLAASFAIIGLWQVYLGGNTESVLQNREIRAFLLDKQRDKRTSQEELNNIRFQCSSLPTSDAMRDFIADHLLKGYHQALQTQPPQTMQRHDKIATVAKLLEPAETPTTGDWFVLSMGAFYASIATSLYLNAFLFTMWDLCFWLIELRMKLNICTAVLKRYDATSGLAEGRLSILHRWDKYLEALGHNPMAEVDESTEPRPIRQRPNKPQNINRVASEFILGGGGGPVVGQDVGWLMSWWYRLSASGLKIIERFFSKPFVSEPEFVNDTADYQPRPDTSRDLCNVGVIQVAFYLIANHSTKRQICEEYAARLLDRDYQVDYSCSYRKTSEKFLTSTYLDFRLFQDSIDDCRNSMNFLIGYSVFQAINILISSLLVEDLYVRFGLIVAGFIISNLTLIGASFFQSQCSKLQPPIYSILAASTRCNKTVRHLALLWRRLLTDLSGSRSKFSLRVYSLNISYATALQFNLSVASLYILAMDKTRFT